MPDPVIASIGRDAPLRAVALVSRAARLAWRGEAIGAEQRGLVGDRELPGLFRHFIAVVGQVAGGGESSTVAASCRVA